jgi:hypothetical protein
LTNPTPQHQPQIFSAIAILIIFASIIFFAWYALNNRLKDCTYAPAPVKATCHIGKMVGLNKVLQSEHLTHASHFQVVYKENGRLKSASCFFSQFPLEKLQALAQASEAVCILPDANKSNTIGVFRPQYH